MTHKTGETRGGRKFKLPPMSFALRTVGPSAPKAPDGDTLMQATRLFAALLLSGLALAALPAHAQLPTVTTRTEIWSGNGQPLDREAAERAQWEQWQLQRDQQRMQREQWRQQREQTRQDDQRIRQQNEPVGQRALREQAENRRQQGRMATPR